MHGVVFAFLYEPPLVPPGSDPRAHLIPRCSEGVVVAAFALHRHSVSIFWRTAALNPARFSGLADMLTFLRLSSRRTQNFASRLAKQNNAQP
ncbi:hypothetical protein CVM73_17665 [Bradyrhizobium forestalis]|uniref:Uncharacterized protein n=1 Tax=Bradyrhizobium forestalis TaxID=1419263 RepID=A0A2M8R846_9BRAD|nr:hypothetical protein CVM73_17665 [Bradyrhizobium forestalis]